MRSLNSAPVFFLLALVSLYAVWNPSGMSLWDVWDRQEWPLPVMLLASLVVGALLLTMVAAAWRSLGFLGSLVLLALVGLLVWTAVDLGWLIEQDARFLPWLWQPITAAIITVGFRWPRFWRAITGRVGTYDDPA